MPKRVSLTTWEREEPGPNRFWGKVERWLRHNKESGEGGPKTLRDLGLVWDVSDSAISRWGKEGRLPPAKCIFWLADQWDQDPRDVIDPAVPIGAKRVSTEKAAEMIRRLPAAEVEDLSAALADARFRSAGVAFGRALGGRRR